MCLTSSRLCGPSWRRTETHRDNSTSFAFNVKLLVSRRHFLHDVLTLLTSTVASQALLFAVLPALTRVYSIEQFGIFGAYSAAVGILGIFINLRLDLSVVTADSNDRAAKLVKMAICVAGAGAMALSLLAWIGCQIYALHTHLIAPQWIWTTPVAAGAIAVFNTLGSWHNRHSRFRTMASYRFIQTVLLVALQFVFVGIWPFKDGLIWGSLLAYLATAIIWSAQTYREDRPFVSKREPIEWRDAFLEVKTFSLQAMGVDALSQVLYQLPLVFLGYLFSPVAMGYYTLTQRVLAVPANLVGSSVAEVFRQRATAAFHDRGECREVFVKTGYVLGGISLAVGLPLFWLLPDLFTMVFGAKWRPAAEFARILLPVYLMKFVSHPLTYVILLAGKLRFELWLHVIMLGFLASGMAIAGYIQASAHAVLAFYAVAYALCYLAYLVYSLKLSRGQFVRNT